MICKVRETVLRHGMFANGGKVLVGLSGGADSMSLLHSLLMLKDELGIEVFAAHVNHCLRGDESERDEAFVRKSCEQLGVELKVLRVDVAAEAEKTGEGLEECGRRLRYEFFDSFGNVTVATAHNLNDRIETLLFNFTRGAALRGLCSVPAKRGKIVRPLIDCSRAEIETFCRENGIEYVTDSTNADVEYSRNRIRHRVLPELKTLNPAFEAAAQRCLNSINEDEVFLLSLAGEAAGAAKVPGGYSAAELKKAAPPIKKRALYLILSAAMPCAPDAGTLDRAAKTLETGGRLQLPGGGMLRVRGGVLEFPETNAGENDPSFCKTLTVGTNSPGDGTKNEITFEIVNKDDTNKLQNGNTSGLEIRLDCDKIKGAISVRSRQPGDAFSPAGRGCTKTLKKLFNEKAIAPEKRNGIYIFEDENGIIAVEGCGVDRRCALTDGTKNTAILKIRREK